MRVRESTQEKTQPEREEEEEVEALSRFPASDWIVFKLVIGGSNVVGSTPNLVSLFLTLSTSIWLAGLRIGSVEHQI